MKQSLQNKSQLKKLSKQFTYVKDQSQKDFTPILVAEAWVIAAHKFFQWVKPKQKELVERPVKFVINSVNQFLNWPYETSLLPHYNYSFIHKL